jgi:AraC family transcriptional activator FtrA
MLGDRLFPPGTHAAAAPAPQPRIRHRVAVLVLPTVHAFELAVAHEVFGLARPEVGVEWYDFRVCATTGEEIDVGGFTIRARWGLDGLRGAGTVVVPAASPLDEPPAAALAALRAAHADGARVVSYCSGAFALAAANLLDGRPATTHWMYTETLASRYPSIDLHPDVLYVDDGDILTSAGTSAAIDVSLHLVRRDYGSEVANYIARRMVVPPHRDGGQAQYIDRPIPAREGDYELAGTLDWIAAHLGEPLTIEQMAGHALMSARTFLRRFRDATGTTPLRWLLLQRIRRARELLEATDVPIERIAAECGFGTAANLRTHFQRVVATTPTAYRRAFRAQAGPAPVG